MRGIASTHFVKYSIAAMMYLCPFAEEGVILPTRSNPHIENGNGDVMGFNSRAGAWMRSP